jgi:hypothetical protein
LAKDKWPTTLEEWEEAARQEVWQSKYIQTTLGDRKNFNMSLQEAKWRAALQIPEGGSGKKPRQNNRRNNEVVPMEVDYASTQEQTPHLKCLTPNEWKKLMDEGRCFKCQLKGHQARQCPTKGQPSNPSTARNAKMSQNKAKTPNDSPPTYDETQIAGLIRAMSTEQRETLLCKVASPKGKEHIVVDDRDPSFQSDDEECFWPPPSYGPGQGSFMYKLPV